VSDALHFHVVGELASLREGRMLPCTIEGRAIVLCRSREGVFALDDVCTHAEARMSDGRLRGTRLVCPLHGAAFDTRDGRVLAGPATRALPTHPLRIVDGRIEVALDPAAPPLPDAG
jgi:nitrite reductase/ring-hydroxylating ferredoxin subunit